MADDVKSLLLTPRLPRRAVEIDGVGKIVVRGMTLAERSAMRETSDENLVVQAILQACVVEPELTADEVAEWCAIAPMGEIVKVVTTILDLSGLSEAAQAAIAASFRR